MVLWRGSRSLERIGTERFTASRVDAREREADPKAGLFLREEAQSALGLVCSLAGFFESSALLSPLRESGEGRGGFLLMKSVLGRGCGREFAVWGER